MAEKDFATKALLNQPDVFADVVNAVLFDGKPEIRPEALTPVVLSSSIHRFTDDKHHDVIRDNAFLWKNGAVFVVLGVENQAKIEEDMVLRVMGYDGAVYQEQVVKHRSKPTLPYLPVTTVVLNYTKKQWTAPKSVYEFFARRGISSADYHFSDYKVRVCDVAYQSADDLAKFKSDFKILASLLTAAYYSPDDASMAVDGHPVVHEYELGRVVKAFDDERAVQSVLQMWEEDIAMVNPLSAYLPGGEAYERSRKEERERGRQEGLKEGRQEGRQEERMSLIKMLMRADGISKEEACRKLGLDPRELSIQAQQGALGVSRLKFER